MGNLLRVEIIGEIKLNFLCFVAVVVFRVGQVERREALLQPPFHNIRTNDPDMNAC